MIQIRIPDRLAYKLQRSKKIPFGFKLQLVLDPKHYKTKLYYRLMRY